MPTRVISFSKPCFIGPACCSPLPHWSRHLRFRLLTIFSNCLGVQPLRRGKSRRRASSVVRMVNLPNSWSGKMAEWVERHYTQFYTWSRRKLDRRGKGHCKTVARVKMWLEVKMRSSQIPYLIRYVSNSSLNWCILVCTSL